MKFDLFDAARMLHARLGDSATMEVGASARGVEVTIRVRPRQVQYQFAFSISNAEIDVAPSFVADERWQEALTELSRATL